MQIVDNYSSKAGKQLRAAFAIAETSRCSHRHGAVLVKNGVVIAGSSNIQRQPQLTGWEEGSWRRSSVHAEAAVIGMAGNQASGATLYVARIGRMNQVSPSRPCIRCLGLAERAGIRKIVHT